MAQVQRTPVRVELPAELGIPEAETLKGRLVELIEAEDSIELEASKVRRVGTAALQVLLALQLELGKTGRSLVWVGASESLRAAALTLGLSQALQLDAATTS